MIFDSIVAAYCWALEVLMCAESAHGPSFDAPRGGNGDARLHAAQVMKEAERACRAGKPCPIHSATCQRDRYCPDPSVEYPTPTHAAERRYGQCDGEFEERLQVKGYITWRRDFHRRRGPA